MCGRRGRRVSSDAKIWTMHPTFSSSFLFGSILHLPSNFFPHKK